MPIIPIFVLMFLLGVILFGFLTNQLFIAVMGIFSFFMFLINIYLIYKE